MNKPFLKNAVSGMEGEGAEVNRLFPVQGFMNFDPFVLWDNFTVPPSAGFPDHPHRGFEGVTYVFDGSMMHKDNLGNDSTVEAGGLQRFTAGAGIVHSEMPSPDKATHGIQMWVNLPASLKKVSPEYQQVDSQSVVEHALEHDGMKHGHVRYLIGENAKLKIKTPMLYMDVSLDEGVFTQDIPDGFRGFVYMVEGDAKVNGELLTTHQAQFHTDTDVLKVDANETCRFMVCFGKPHGEPIYQHGPYVD